MPEDFRLRTEGLRRGYRACDRLIAPSWAFMQTTAALYGVAPEAVRNGRRAPSSARVDKEPLVLTSGRLWDEGKNVAVLDRAAARMRSPVLAAGDLKGPQGQSSHFGHALALGRLSAPALAAQLERASVFASMSLYEPFGLGVLEAAQAGCALVLSDIPTFRELWGGVAAFVPAHDDVALAEALDALVENPAEARERGAAAAERAGKFTIDAMVAGTLRVYGQALAAHAPCPEAAA